jgi:hypothetical protein
VKARSLCGEDVAGDVKVRLHLSCVAIWGDIHQGGGDSNGSATTALLLTLWQIVTESHATKRYRLQKVIT